MRRVLGWDNEITLLSSQCIGFLASYPFVVVLTCVRGAGAQNIWGCISHIVREHGLLALWTGILPWIASKIIPLVLSELIDNTFEKLNEHILAKQASNTNSTVMIHTLPLVNSLVKAVVCVGVACPFEAIAFKKHAFRFTSKSIPWQYTGLRSIMKLYCGYTVDCVSYLVERVVAV